jgi:hypothetical protein
VGHVLISDLKMQYTPKFRAFSNEIGLKKRDIRDFRRDILQKSTAPLKSTQMDIATNKSQYIQHQWSNHDHLASKVINTTDKPQAFTKNPLTAYFNQ